MLKNHAGHRRSVSHVQATKLFQEQFYIMIIMLTPSHPPLPHRCTLEWSELPALHWALFKLHRKMVSTVTNSSHTDIDLAQKWPDYAVRSILLGRLSQMSYEYHTMIGLAAQAQFIG